MNLSREKAIEAMDLLVANDYSVNLSASVIRGETYYRIECLALHYDDTDLRALCDLAESIGLHARLSLQAIRFEMDPR